MNDSKNKQGNSALAKFKLYYEELPGSDLMGRDLSASRQRNSKSS